MMGLEYTIRLEEPVLANSLAGDANSARTLACVPGGLIRGALIGIYLSQNNKSKGDTQDDEFRRLFLNGETRYLNAYPIQKDERMLPLPLSWVGRKKALAQAELKLQSEKIYNLATREWKELMADSMGNGEAIEDEPEKVPGEYGRMPADRLYSCDLPLQYNFHTQRDAIPGRATEDFGAVFRYEALPAGLKLQGIILANSRSDLDKIERLLTSQETLFLGKSRTAGYGHVSVEVSSIKRLHSGWREGWIWPPEPDGDEEANETETAEEPRTTQSFILTFLTTAILRDGNGHYTSDPRNALAAHLGCSVNDIEQKKCFLRTEIVGGFNRTWGLPLPQAKAISAGSVFVYHVQAGVEVDRLRKIEERGIGERRAEGFGRVADDLKQPKSLDWSKEESPMLDTLPTVVENGIGADSKNMIDLLLKRLLMQELEARLKETVREHWIRDEIPNSQLSRWRTVVRGAMAQAEVDAKQETVKAFFKHEVEKRSQAFQKLERARMSDYQHPHLSVSQWLKELLKAKSPWPYLNYGTRTPSITLDAYTYSADENLAVDYILRLIDAVFAHREKLNKPAKKGE